MVCIIIIIIISGGSGIKVYFVLTLSGISFEWKKIIWILLFQPTTMWLLLLLHWEYLLQSYSSS